MSAVRREDRFPALDGLRAAGALAVLMTHVGFQSGDALVGPFAGLLSRLDAGVAVFFVISGFLLFRPYAVAHLTGRPSPGVGQYLWHRAVRILPVLWLVVAAAWVLLPTPGTTWVDYARQALLVNIYSGNYMLLGLTQMWSLATEAAFYLVLPALAWLVLRGLTGKRWVLSMAAVCLGAFMAGPVWMGVCTAIDRPQGRLWLPGFIGWFAAGIALAVWSAARSAGVLSPSRIEAVLRHPGTVWSLAAALFVLSSTPLAGPLDLSAPSPGAAASKNALYGLIGLLIVAPAVVPRAASQAGLRHLSGRVGHFLGSVSYGVFAYHVLALALVERALGLRPFTGQFGARFVGTLVVSMVAATVSFYLLERPLMRRARKREQQSPIILDPSTGPAAQGPMPLPAVRRPG